jgi:hypothetical protein
MITYDAAARDELLAMHDSYALRDPVVVFGMAAKLIDQDDYFKKAFLSGDLLFAEYAIMEICRCRCCNSAEREGFWQR